MGKMSKACDVFPKVRNCKSIEFNGGRKMNYPDTREFSRRLHNIRRSKNLKQHELAELMEINACQVSGYETGKWEPGLFTIGKFCAALDVTASELLGF
jgi:DNA-binding XRE family transcriptional regulator